MLEKEIINFINIYNKPYSYTEKCKNIFYKAGVNFIKGIAKAVGAEVISVNYNPSGDINRGCVSGFIKKNKKFIYVNISDSNLYRDKNNWYSSYNIGPILYREASSERDYTGKSNNFAKVSKEGIIQMIEKMKLMLNGGQ